MEEEMPTLVNFCVWLYRQPTYYSAHTMGAQRMATVEGALTKVRQFIEAEGKDGAAFLDVCREMAGKEK